MDRSPLAKLPRELRDSIYRLALPHDSTLHVTAAHTGDNEVINNHAIKLVSPYPIVERQSSLTATCRQMRKEFQSTYRRHILSVKGAAETAFNFPATATACSFMRSLDPVDAAAIRSICVAELFTVSQIFHGVRLVPALHCLIAITWAEMWSVMEAFPNCAFTLSLTPTVEHFEVFDGWTLRGTNTPGSRSAVLDMRNLAASTASEASRVEHILAASNTSVLPSLFTEEYHYLAATLRMLEAQTKNEAAWEAYLDDLARPCHLFLQNLNQMPAVMAVQGTAEWR